MHCPFCLYSDTKVLETRLSESGNNVKRRRKCNGCNRRYSTIEIAELEMPRVIKASGVSEGFNEAKLKNGFIKALEKRPVSSENIDSAIIKLKQILATNFDGEIKSKEIGNLVMSELKKLDKVAYIRFASVYRHFQDVEEFKIEIEKLMQK